MNTCYLHRPRPRFAFCPCVVHVVLLCHATSSTRPNSKLSLASLGSNETGHTLFRMESEIGKSSRSVLASETVCVTVIVLHHHGYATMWTFRSFISQEDMDENHLYGIMLEHTRIP